MNILLVFFVFLKVQSDTIQSNANVWEYPNFIITSWLSDVKIIPITDLFQEVKLPKLPCLKINMVLPVVQENNSWVPPHHPCNLLTGTYNCT